MKHVLAIKSSLGIENVHSETSVWRSKPRNEEKGAQIDLLIDRQDRCINVCEIKFSTGTFEITKKYAAELENKLQAFRNQTRTRKTLFITMITTYGKKNKNDYDGMVQQ